MSLWQQHQQTGMLAQGPAGNEEELSLSGRTCVPLCQPSVLPLLHGIAERCLSSGSWLLGGGDQERWGLVNVYEPSTF